MNILIGADIVPTNSNQYLFEAGDAKALLGEELTKLLHKSSLNIFNLEVPLTNEERPIDKCGPDLIASPASVKGYEAIGVNVVTIANNHILDQGATGFFDTLKQLESCGIAYVGGGVNSEEARRPLIVELEGKRIGIYACTEHEFSIATDECCGANPFDSLETPDHVHSLAQQCDYVIVLYHGGKEHYRYPSPRLQRVCRKLVEKGADLVVCQHSHCIGCQEKFMGGTIVYGQGNFLFDEHKYENSCWKTGLLVQVDHNFSITYVPVVKEGNGVRLAGREMREKILAGFMERSREIQTEGFVQCQYEAFSKAMINGYLTAFSGHQGVLIRGLNKLSGNRLRPWLLRRKYRKKELLAIQNFVECEAHRELLLQGLREDSM